MDGITRVVENTTLLLQKNSGFSNGYKDFIGNNCERQSFIDFEDLTNYWEKIWENFGGLWCKQRQDYRYLFESYKMFFYGLQELQNSFFTSMDSENRIFFLVSSLYLYGKKCNDLIKKIDKEFWKKHDLEKFSQTRNKIFEHNYDIRGGIGSFDVFGGSLTNSDRYLIVTYHSTHETNEQEFYIDYFNDFFVQQKRLKDFLMNHTT